MSGVIRGRLVLYFLSLLLCTGMGLAWKSYTLFAEPFDETVFKWLTTALCIAFPLQGAVNALLYGVNVSLMEGYWHMLCCCFTCCSKRSGSYAAVSALPKSRSYGDGDEAFDPDDFASVSSGDSDDGPPPEVYMTPGASYSELNTSLLSGKRKCTQLTLSPHKHANQIKNV